MVRIRVLELLFDQAVRDTIQQLSTGSPVITDGEQSASITAFWNVRRLKDCRIRRPMASGSRFRPGTSAVCLA